MPPESYALVKTGSQDTKNGLFGMTSRDNVSVSWRWLAISLCGVVLAFIGFTAEHAFKRLDALEETDRRMVEAVDSLRSLQAMAEYRLVQLEEAR